MIILPVSFQNLYVNTRSLILRRTPTEERSTERHHEAGRGAGEIETVEDDARAAADRSSSRVSMILHQPFYPRKVFPQTRPLHFH